MPIATGTHIGPYEIAGWLGSGGMGEVYRARDSRFAREVAIKLIPERFVTDSSRLRRFEQEARAAGQLDHPNVLAVHDVGLHAGAPFIVSELLEGESLGSRLRSGAIPPRKAIDYARQIAEGLAAAHAKGVVHRDLKPDNIFIGSSGRVTILDFGLAKLTEPVDDEARQRPPAAETEPGMVLGTSGYISPEQLRGEEVDARSDIFSFGAILYQMLTGRPAFVRATVPETMAAILTEDPPEPSHVPEALERVVSRCLEKSREARFQSARDLAFSLGVLSAASTTATPSTRSGTGWRGGLRPAALPWALAGALAFLLATVLVQWAPWREVPGAVPQHLSVDLGADTPLAPLNVQFGDATTLSPDGAVVAFVGQEGESDRARLYVRRLDQLRAAPLSGTAGALAPFFSPDGQWIGFFADGKLKKIGVRGGAPVTLADAPSNRGGTWGEDGTIVFSPHQLPNTVLLRVSSAGGSAEPLTSLAVGEVLQLWPQILPGATAVLYTSSSVTSAHNDADLVVLPLQGGARKVVQRGGYHGRYVAAGPSSPTRGHLVYIHDGTLFAAPFDLGRLEVTGQPRPVLEGVASNSITGGAQFSVSENGTLAYLPGATTGAGTTVHWVDRQGATSALRPSLANWFDVRFAPDGQRLALDIREGQSDVWIYEWARDAMTRLTPGSADNRRPVWTPDGRRIVFASTQGEGSTSHLYWQRVDGTGKVQRLTEGPNPQQPSSWHPSGRFLAFSETVGPTNVDVMIMPLEGDEASGWTPGAPTAMVSGPGFDFDPMFSPDGRWLAYSSNESGRNEVYVQPFPGPGSKSLVSTGGGHHPIWSGAAREIVYGLNGQIMVAAFSVEGGVFRADKPRPWPGGRYQTRGQNRMFDLHPDGTRIALAPPVPAAGTRGRASVVLVSNFGDELRSLGRQPPR